jgi:prevent-host-death family protein
MEASLTELARHTKDVVRPVQASGEVTLTEHGQPFAKIVPIRKFDRKAAARMLKEIGLVDVLPRK